MYYPTRYPNGLWELRTQVGAMDAQVNARIHGWFIRRPESRLATLFLHGNAGNITYREAHFREIPAAGSSLLMIDYRGYGKSAGRPTESGLYADADAGYDWLLQAGYRPEEIILHGESLGSAVAVDLASRRRCGGMILEAPFTSARDVAASVLPVLGPALVWGFDSRSKIGAAKTPVLFIQGDRDEVIPLRLGQALFAAAREPKSLWIVPRAGHNDLVEIAGPEYRRRLASFYQGLR